MLNKCFAVLKLKTNKDVNGVYYYSSVWHAYNRWRSWLPIVDSQLLDLSLKRYHNRSCTFDAMLQESKRFFQSVYLVFWISRLVLLFRKSFLAKSSYQLHSATCMRSNASMCLLHSMIFGTVGQILIISKCFLQLSLS